MLALWLLQCQILEICVSSRSHMFFMSHIWLTDSAGLCVFSFGFFFWIVRVCKSHALHCPATGEGLPLYTQKEVFPNNTLERKKCQFLWKRLRNLFAKFEQNNNFSATGFSILYIIFNSKIRLKSKGKSRNRQQQFYFIRMFWKCALVTLNPK